MEQAEVKRFHNDLRAAVVAGVPIDIGDGKSEFLSLHRIDELENLIVQPTAAETDNQKSPANAAGAVSRRYNAALQVFGRLGTMTPVLEGLTARILAKRTAIRTLRWTIIYLLLLLLCAVAGLWLFLEMVVPAFENIRADLLLPAAINAPQRLELITWIPGIIVVMGFCFVVLLIWFLFGGSTQVAMWLGGRHFVRCQVSTSTLRTLRALLDAGLDLPTASSLSCDLTGANSAVRQDIKSMVQSPTNAIQIDAIQNYLTISANQRLASMKVAMPIALVTTIGGAIGLLYCVTIFWPIVALVKDMTTAGT